MKEIRTVKKLDAEFEAPPAKAYTLRALFIAALADGKSILKNALNAEDQKHAVNALNAFGAKIEFNGNDYVVDGTGGKFESHEEKVFVGNSGVTSRFIVPIAGLAKGNSVIDGDDRMRERPIQDLLDAMQCMGLKAKSKNGCPPVEVEGGSFEGGITNIFGNKSSQYLSALLIAAPYTKKGLLVRIEGELKSRPYIDITLDCMRSFGVNPVNRDYKEFYVRQGKGYCAREYEVEGDYSSASYFFAAAAITRGKVKVNNLNPGSVQGDKFFLTCLERMGCKVYYGKDFVEVVGGDLKGIDVDMADCPDVVPTLGVVAAFAEGRTSIFNIGHLVLKESNRIKTTASNLKACGVPCVAKEDSLVVVGKTPHGAEIETFNDHRIAMAFSVMGLAVEGMKIKNSEVVKKSFPGFFEELERAYGARE